MTKADAVQGLMTQQHQQGTGTLFGEATREVARDSQNKADLRDCLAGEGKVLQQRQGSLGLQ